jgi:hypothetical protein
MYIQFSPPAEQNDGCREKTIHDYLCQHSKMNINRMFSVAVPNSG